MPVFRGSNETYKHGRTFPTGEEVKSPEYGRILVPVRKIRNILRGPIPAAPRREGERATYPTNFGHMVDDSNSPAYRMLIEDISKRYPLMVMPSLKEYQKLNPRALGHEDGKGIVLGVPSTRVAAHEVGALLMRELDPKFDHEKYHETVFRLEEVIADYYRAKAN